MQVKRKKLKVFKSFILILLVLLSFNPYLIVIQHIPSLNVLGGSLLHVILIPFFVVLLGNKGITKLPLAIRICLVVQVLGYFLSFIVHGGVGYLLVFAVLLLMILMFSYIDNRIGMVHFFSLYNKWILLMAIGGVGIFVLGQIMGVPPLYRVPSVISETSTISSWGIGYTNCYFPESPLSFIRYSGFFDEPGAMGYWGIYALVINKLFIKDKRIEWMLLVTLMFTFSLGYYVQALAYVFLFYGLSRVSGRNIILIAIMGVVLLWSYSTRNTENSQVYKATFGRFDNFQRVGDDFVLEDRRSELTELAKKTFLENPVMGVGIKEWSKLPYMADNPYETLAKDGLIGTFYLYFPFLMLIFIALNRKRWDWLKGFIVIGLGFLHRPFHENLLAFFMLYSILYLTIKSLNRNYSNETISVNNNRRLQ